MQCLEVTERLLGGELGVDAELDRHVGECVRCAHVVRSLERLDGVLASSMVVAPPLDLQRQLAQLALAYARPGAASWWTRLGHLHLAVGPWLAQRPHMLAAQGLAAIMLALASWQVFGWVNTFQPVVGDVGYAMELVAASPATNYLAAIQFDMQSMVIWSVVGISGWLISENGWLGRRLTSTRLRLP